MQNNLA